MVSPRFADCGSDVLILQRACLGPDRPLVTVVVERGVIASIGAEHTISAPAGAAVEDLAGALLLPAFVDAHVHLSHTGMQQMGVDLGGTRSITEALNRIAATARAHPGRAIYAPNWQEQQWVESRTMTSAELDRASADGIVYSSRIDGHSAVVSSALAQRCGADQLDGWSPSGHVSRAAKNAARSAFDDAVPAAQRRDAIELALRSAAASGLASVHECGGPLLTSAADFADALELGRRADLPEVIGYWAEQVETADEAAALVQEHGAAGLAGDLNIDGSIGSHTAHLFSDYADAPGERGTAYRSREEVARHVSSCAQAGVQSGFHVIGDQGVRTVLEGYRLAAHEVGADLIRRSRPRLEHVEMIGADGLATMADLGIAASVQPVFDAIWGGPTSMYAERLGPARVPGMNPLAGFLRQGVLMALGSDSPVTPFDPWGAVAAAMTHHDDISRLSLAEALVAHTARGHLIAGRAAPTVGVGSPATCAAWRGDPDALVSAGSPQLVGLWRRGVRLA